MDHYSSFHNNIEAVRSAFQHSKIYFHTINNVCDFPLWPSSILLSYITPTLFLFDLLRNGTPLNQTTPAIFISSRCTMLFFPSFFQLLLNETLEHGFLIFHFLSLRGARTSSHQFVFFIIMYGCAWSSNSVIV